MLRGAGRLARATSFARASASPLAKLLIAACLCAAVAPGADFWDRKPPAQWTEEEVVRILVDSPWGTSTTETFDFREAEPSGPITWRDLGVPGDGGSGVMNTGSPVGGIGAPMSKSKIDVDINVRWSSAVPVRQAAALTKFGPDAIGTDEARKFVEREDSFYVLEISGVPLAVASQGIEAMQFKIHQDARLTTASGRVLEPDSVYVSTRGQSLNIAIRFAKTEPITLADKQLEFFVEYGLLTVERKFKLKDMVFEGRLEL